MDIPLIHPVCNPKYMFEKHITMPMTSPTTTPRTVKFCGASARSANILCASAWLWEVLYEADVAAEV
jgi:hypothetical protein